MFTRLTELFAAPSLHGSKLVVDYTGVGTAGAGHAAESQSRSECYSAIRHFEEEFFGRMDVEAGWYHGRSWPRRLQVLSQSRRLRVAPALPEASDAGDEN